MRGKLMLPLAALLVATGCGSSGDGAATGGGQQNREPLRIALVPPSGGTLEQMGQAATQGWEYAAAEANAKGGVDGHKVELIKSKTDMQPATTVRAVRKAVTQDHAKYVSGIVSSPEHGALQQQLAGLGAISLLGNGQDDALTGAGCSPNAFRATQAASMLVGALTKTLADLPAKKWSVLTVDYSTGHTAAKVFAQAAKASGKQVVQTQFSPIGTTEFGSYISKIKASGADGFFGLVPGSDGVSFITQGTQFKLFEGLRSVLSYDMVTVPLFDALGDKVVGFMGNVGYDVNAANAKNQAFVKGYTKMFGDAPYTVPADNYLAAEMLFAAVKKAGSVEPEKVKAALDGLTFDSIAGRVKVGPDHQLIRPAYVAKVVKKGDGLAFEVVKEVPGSELRPTPNRDCKLAG
jgi:ABC-type branched-subunit amino acid transport system substrate-binding protein